MFTREVCVKLDPKKSNVLGTYYLQLFVICVAPLQIQNLSDCDTKCADQKTALLLSLLGMIDMCAMLSCCDIAFTKPLRSGFREHHR